MTKTECIEPHQLQRFLLGELPASDWERVASHVEDCEICEQTISQFDRAEDTLVQSLRAPVSSNGDSPAYQLAARRAKAMKISAPPVEADGGANGQYLRDYELLEPIGRGGMGTVYRGLHRRLRREVAVKVLPARCLHDAHSVARFQREMQAVGQLRHSAIVQATDGGDADGVHYLVMELIDGIDLSTLVKCMGPLPPADACELARRAAQGLAYAHAQGVIHRDIKPSNIMLTADGEVKILDLGLARIVGEQWVTDELTTVGQLMGTLDYMPPEQFENSHTADERCDVYGLGATLFKLLSVNAPYAAPERDSPLAKLRRIANEPAPKLAAILPQLPLDLCQFVDRMLSRQPEERPNMSDVAAQLSNWSGGQRIRELARTAMEKRQANKTQPPVSSHPSVIEGPSPPNRPPEPTRPEPKTGKRSVRWLAGIGLLTLAVALAVVITIQTRAGQLVIETVKQDVIVRIVKAGQPYRTLTLTQQANALKLGAGEYEVELVGGDGLRVENNHFTVSRGETVVARIVHHDLEAVAAAQTSLSPVASNEPRYDGKATSEWIAVLYQDRSPVQVIKAFEALAKLGLDSERYADVIKATFHAARFHSESTVVPQPDGKTSVNLWSRAASTLNGFDAQAVVNEIQRSIVDPQYRSKQFPAYLLQKHPDRYRPHLTDELLNQMIDLAVGSKGPERATSIAAIAALLGSDHRKFVELCLNWLGHQDEELRLHAASQLAKSNQPIPELVDGLRQLMKSPNLNTRIEAVAISADLGPAAQPLLPELLSFVESKNEPVVYSRDVRVGVTRAFRISVQEQAIESLGIIGVESAVPALLQELRRRMNLKLTKQVPSNTDVQSNLIHAIGSLTGLRWSTTSGGVIWLYQGASLDHWTEVFLSSQEPQLSEARSAIQKLMIVESDPSVFERAFLQGMQFRKRTVNESTPERALELIRLMEPTLSKKGVLLALIEAIRNVPTRVESSGQVTGGLQFQLFQNTIKSLTDESPELKNQAFDKLIELFGPKGAIYARPGVVTPAHLVIYIEILITLGNPDPDRRMQLIAHLEKVKASTSTESHIRFIDRALKHLDAKPDEERAEP